MIAEMAKRLAKASEREGADGNGPTGPKSPGFSPGVHISTSPLAVGGALLPKGKPASADSSEARWETMPKGWTADSRAKFAKSIDSAEGPVSNCMKKIGKHVSDPGAFCASLQDRVSGTTKWRSGGKKKKSEADSGSANAAVLRAPKQKESKTQTVEINSRTRMTKLKEASSPLIPQKFQVVLIQEGLGNFGDCFYYTKGCLQAAAPIFEGKKCFADHPSSIEEQVLPERSTRDVLGYYENVQYRETDGRGALEANFVLMPGVQYDWARSLLTNALDYTVKYPNAEFVGFSINASGEAGSVNIDEFIKTNDIPPSVLPKLLEAKEQGITEIRPVSTLKNAVSCDLVTEAGAGGKILKMIEQEKKMKKKESLESKKEAAEKEAMEAAGKDAMESSEHEATEADGDQPAASGDSGDDADHADADQDKALFQKMIAQYLGEDHVDDEECMKMAKHSLEAHHEAGMEGKEAYEAAGQHLKMAAAIGKKMAAAAPAQESKEDDSGSGDSSDAIPAGGKQKVPANAGKSGDAMPKEAIHRQLIKANAELASLRESVKRIELKEYLDKKLSESKKAVSVTKKFREALGAPRSKEQIDTYFKIFMTAYDSGVVDSEETEVGFFTEKNASAKSSSGEAGSFADCVK